MRHEGVAPSPPRMLDAFTGQLPLEAWYPARESGVTSRQVDLSTGEVVRIVESGEAGAPAVVLVHGWGCSAYFFRHLIHPLVAAGYRTVSIDLRGHGASSKPVAAGAYRDVAMRDFVLAALDGAGVGAAHVIAHSLGGAISLDIARHAPARVRSLTLLAPVGLAPVRFVALARLATPPIAAPLVPYAVPRWSIPLILRTVYGTEGRWASRDVDEYWAPTVDPGFALALRSLLHEFRFAPRADAELDAVVAPTLVLLGERDLLVRARASAARSARRGWGCATIAGAGHVLAEEVPALVLSHVLPHLGAVDGPALVHSPPRRGSEE